MECHPGERWTWLPERCMPTTDTVEGDDWVSGTRRDALFWSRLFLLTKLVCFFVFVAATANVFFRIHTRYTVHTGF